MPLSPSPYRTPKSLLVFALVLASGCDDAADVTANEPPLDAEPWSCPDGTTAWRATHEDGTRITWCKDAGGLAHGPYEERYDGGVLTTGTFLNGRPHGHWVWTDRNSGATTRAGDYANGLPDGAFFDYAADGVTVTLERHYVAGEPCGVWIAYDGGLVTAAQPFAACPSDPVEPGPPDPDLVAPVTTDWGWDGLACPDGATLVEAQDGGLTARSCEVGGVRHGPHGLWDDEDKRLDGAYDLGQRTGLWREWYAGGESHGGLRARGSFVADAEHGAWKTWRADGSLEARGDYADGQRTGTWQGLHPNGVEAWTGAFVDGLEHGVWVYRRADGTREAEVVFAAGERTGMTEYLWTGQRDCMGDLAEGQRQGLWTCWHENGVEASRREYQLGLVHGTGAYFDRLGRPTLTGTWVHGTAHGTFTAWEDLGYFDGVAPLRTRRTYEVVAGLVEGAMVGVWELPGDPKESEVHYTMGVREGPWTQWYPSGAVGVEGHFLQGLPHKRWRVYYESGSLQVDEGFWQGQLHEAYTEYWENGAKRVEGAYAYGTPTGPFTFWDEAGAATTVDCRATPEVCP